MIFFFPCYHWLVYNDQGVPAAFKVPSSAVLPLGSMEDALKKSGSLESYTSLGQLKSKMGELDTLPLELQATVSLLSPTEETIKSMKTIFPEDGRLIVRSSALCFNGILLNWPLFPTMQGDLDLI